MADSGKKRKRTEEVAQKANKKIATQVATPVNSIKVSVVAGADDWAPIVGTQDWIFLNLWSLALNANSP
jgi:hypothetical protein